jgi:hypothetical protein
LENNSPANSAGTILSIISYLMTKIDQMLCGNKIANLAVPKIKTHERVLP